MEGSAAIAPGRRCCCLKSAFVSYQCLDIDIKSPSMIVSGFPVRYDKRPEVTLCLRSEPVPRYAEVQGGVGYRDAFLGSKVLLSHCRHRPA